MSVSALRVVRPVLITPEMLVSTSVPEADYGEWSAGASYSAGDRVIVAAKHKIYQSAVDANTGNNPAVASKEPKWLEVGATNRWKAFDKSVSSQTMQASNIGYRLKVGQAVTSLGVLNIRGATALRVRMIDPSFGTVYDRTINLASIPVSAGWYEWFLGERRTPTQALLTDLPSYREIIPLGDERGVLPKSVRSGRILRSSLSLVVHDAQGFGLHRHHVFLELGRILIGKPQPIDPGEQHVVIEAESHPFTHAPLMAHGVEDIEGVYVFRPHLDPAVLIIRWPETESSQLGVRCLRLVQCPCSFL